MPEATLYRQPARPEPERPRYAEYADDVAGATMIINNNGW
jgi:hypothetical protein